MSASPEMRRRHVPAEPFPKMPPLLPSPSPPTKAAEVLVVAAAEGEEGCRTPKAEEFRIPAVENCPPAPKKPRLTVLPCRRKLQLDLKLVHVKHEETRSFFQMLVPPPPPPPSSKTRKRRKKSHGFLVVADD